MSVEEVAGVEKVPAAGVASEVVLLLVRLQRLFRGETGGTEGADEAFAPAAGNVAGHGFRLEDHRAAATLHPIRVFEVEILVQTDKRQFLRRFGLRGRRRQWRCGIRS